MTEEIIKKDINLDFNMSPIYDLPHEKDVQIVLFKVNYDEFDTHAYNQTICGKTCYEYVKKVCTGFKTIETEIGSQEDPVFYAKSLISREYSYTALLFTDTPLLTTSTFLGALDYAKLKNVNILRLYRGFIFDTDYLFTIQNLFLKEPVQYEPQDFLVCNSYKNLHEITKVMQERIYNYHFENGVKIVGAPDIDADVFIGSGCEIWGASQLFGNTQLSANVVINNSTLNNSIVGENSCILNSFVENSILKTKVVVEPFVCIKNKSIVCENVTIKSGLLIDNQKIEE